MSNIAVAKKALPQADRDKLQVVFVTTDPERDTPDSLGAWLRAQDPSFTGLTGDFATIQPPHALSHRYRGPQEGGGRQRRLHARGPGHRVLAQDRRGYVLYGEGTTVDDYTKDLPKIVKGENP